MFRVFGCSLPGYERYPFHWGDISVASYLAFSIHGLERSPHVTLFMCVYRVSRNLIFGILDPNSKPMELGSAKKEFIPDVGFIY